MAVTRTVFGGPPPTKEELDAIREDLELDRTLAFFDGNQIVATAGIYSFDLTVPGGDSLACGGVTRVSVLPTHRRRGLLRAMMRRQLDEMRERGESLAALLASEAPIYGRFGYGLATYQAHLEVDRGRAAPGWQAHRKGSLALVDVPAAVDAFTRVVETARHHQPGMFALDERWWRFRLIDAERHRRGMSPHHRVVYRVADEPSGFALYRLKSAWDASGPIYELHLEELIAANVEAYAGLWRYLLDVDLTTRIVAPMRSIEEPLRFMLPDPRQPQMRVEDGLWVRLVDVRRALAGRRYAVEGRLVVGVRDEFCPWNTGVYEILATPSGSQCRACDENPDLELSAPDLGALYLGGNRADVLHQAGRIIERRGGAVREADLLFASERAPWCPTHF